MERQPEDKTAVQLELPLTVPLQQMTDEQFSRHLVDQLQTPLPLLPATADELRARLPRWVHNSEELRRLKL